MPHLFFLTVHTERSAYVPISITDLFSGDEFALLARIINSKNDIAL